VAIVFRAWYSFLGRRRGISYRANRAV